MDNLQSAVRAGSIREQGFRPLKKMNLKNGQLFLGIDKLPIGNCKLSIENKIDRLISVIGETSG